MSKKKINSELFQSDKELVEFYSGKLEFIWGKWLTFMNLIISFSAGTVLLFLNAIRVLDTQVSIKHQSYVLISVFSASASLLMAALWRSLAHHFLESDILGADKYLKRYFEAFEIKRGISYGPLSNTPRLFPFQIGLYYLSLWGAILTLVFSWIMGALFLVKNL